MKTIFINGRFLLAKKTGVQRVAWELLHALDDDIGKNPSAVTWRLLAPDTAHEPELRNIKVERVGKLRGQIWEQVFLPFTARRSILVSLANMAPLAHDKNIVMFHDAQAFDTPQSYSAAFRTWYRFAMPKLGRRALRVLTVSDFSARRIVAQGIAQMKKISVIPNASNHLDKLPEDRRILERLGLEPGRYALAFASRQPHKNTDVIRRAFALGEAGDIRLVMIGDAAECNAEHANISGTGSIDDGQLKALYAAAAAFLLPSKIEGFGLPVGEAMSSGSPVIASDVEVLREIWGSAAVLVPADDPVAWRNAVLRVANEPDHRADIVRRGSALVQGYAWPDAARSLRRIAEDVAAQTA